MNKTSVLAIVIAFVVFVHSVDAQCSTSTTCDACTDRSNCKWCNDDDWIGSRCLLLGTSGCDDQSFVNSDCSNSLSGAAIAGIVIGSLIITACIIMCCCYGCAGCYWYNRRMQRATMMNAAANAYPSQPYAPGHPMQPGPYGAPPGGYGQPQAGPYGQPAPYGQPQPGPYGQPTYAQQGQGQVGGMPQYGGAPPQYEMGPQGAPQGVPQYQPAQPQAYNPAPMHQQQPPPWQPSGEGSGMDTSKPMAPPPEGHDDFNPKKPGQ